MRSVLRSTATAAALLLAGASGLLANSIAVQPGRHGGTCGVNNTNNDRYGGNCGARVTLDTGAAPFAYVQDNTPSGEGAYRVRFYVNTSTMAFTAGSFDVFAAYDPVSDPPAGSSAGTPVLRAQLGSGNPRVLNVFGLLDAGGETAIGPFSIASGWHAIEIEWTRAGAGQNNGHLNLWLDGVAQTGTNGLDNDTHTINTVRWGYVSGSPTFSGRLLIDEFASQRTGQIGLVPFTGQQMAADFDGDGDGDVVLERNGSWLFYDYATGTLANTVALGSGGSCIPTPGNYDGDFDSDISRLCSGAWHFYNANGSYAGGIWTGSPPDVYPAPADYDGDGDTDVVIFDNGAWHFFAYPGGAYLGGYWTGGSNSQVRPVPLDYDGDGAAELSLYGQGAWHFFNDNGTYNHGIWMGDTPGNIPVPFDRDGDGDEDAVLFNNNNTWHFFDFATGAYQGGVITARPGGGSYTNPQPAPVDVDGDGHMELSVYEVVGGNGFWHFFSSTGTFLKTINTGAANNDNPISRRLRVASPGI
ncbi:MAG TPA: VCBS repeat-containing protein [Thermoanaerobaculia bacterium]|jgi:hypothetical protein|nr:VCBS repeat-containing protein [Thermoanaerobaculia bacterium]